MNNSKDGPAVNIEVDDAEAAFHRLEEFTRKILAVPKNGALKPAARKGVKARKPKA
jgi:hypothetical protein